MALSKWIASTAGSTAVRTWELEDGTLELQHDHLSGSRLLSLNGCVIYNGNVFPDKSSELRFIYRQQAYAVKIIFDRSALPFSLTFKCTVNGVEKPYQTEAKVSGASNESLEHFTATISGATAKDDTVYYTVNVTVPSKEVLMALGRNFHSLVDKAGQVLSAVKRFSDFVEIHEKVVAALRGDGDHLISGLPQLPAKRWKSWVSHVDANFITDRQAQLQVYLQKLMSVPRVGNLPALRRFLGLMCDKPLETLPEVQELTVASVFSAADAQPTRTPVLPIPTSSTTTSTTSTTEVGSPPSYKVAPPPAKWSVANLWGGGSPPPTPCGEISDASL